MIGVDALLQLVTSANVACRLHAGNPQTMRATVALAAAMGVDPDRLLLTNGGAEAIVLVAAHLPVGQVTAPEFSLYGKHLAAIDEGETAHLARVPG